MEKVLNQEEIDAMVRAARSRGQAEAQLPVQAPPIIWDSRRRFGLWWQAGER
jgi:hypothetical protein